MIALLLYWLRAEHAVIIHFDWPFCAALRASEWQMYSQWSGLTVNRRAYDIYTYIFIHPIQLMEFIKSCLPFNMRIRNMQYCQYVHDICA